MKRISTVMLTFALLIAVCITLGATGEKSGSSAYALSFTESTEILKNPDRGIYMLKECFVKDNANPDFKRGDFQKGLDDAHFPKNTSLFLLSFDLSYYSSNNGGTSKNITANGLKYIENTIANCTADGFNVMLRFSYDLKGESYSHDDIVKFQPEPSLNQVISHISQISPIINKYKDYVYVLQSGMFGPWGEQHSTALSKDQSAYYQMLDAWLNNTDSSIWVAVRYPYHFLDWYNVKYNKTYNQNNIQNIKTKKGTPEYRICMYNDGYLASSEDWGTYRNRNNEIAFFNSQTYAPFGGEACSEKSGGLTSLNAISNVEKEAFQTHTSYLNYQWDYDKVIKYWEKQTYSGKDAVYKNAKTTELNYIINRLGYRLVLRSFTAQKSVKAGENIKLDFSIENVGFGNVSKEQNVYFVLSDSNDNVVDFIQTDIDVQSILSTKTVKFNKSFTVKSTISEGKYKMYLKILPKSAKFDDGTRAIQLANSNIFNSKLCANYLGEIAVEKANSTTNSSDDKKDSTATSSVNSIGSTSQKPSVGSSGNDLTNKSEKPANSTVSDTKSKKGCSSEIRGQNSALFIVLLAMFAFALRKQKK